MPAEGLIFFILGVLGLIVGILWLSIPFILYSIRSSLQEIGETLDDLLEVQLEIARRLGPVSPSQGSEARSPQSPALNQPLHSSPAPRVPERVKEESSLRQQAEQIRRNLQD